MICERIDLYAYFGIRREEEREGRLLSYRHPQFAELGERRVRPAMLVIPGGAYAFWSERGRGARRPCAIMRRGFDCFVLEYDIAPVSYPAQILQAGMAMLYLRKEAEALSIDPAHIAAVGFSAGGHLCGCISYLWDDAALRAAFGEECARIRPDAAILSYPVISADKEVAHADSFRNFCGDAVSPQAYSFEKHIRLAAPPTFVWATSQDALVPPQNALLLCAALLRQGGSGGAAPVRPRPARHVRLRGRRRLCRLGQRRDGARRALAAAVFGISPRPRLCATQGISSALFCAIERLFRPAVRVFSGFCAVLCRT